MRPSPGRGKKPRLGLGRIQLLFLSAAHLASQLSVNFLRYGFAALRSTPACPGCSQPSPIWPWAAPGSGPDRAGLGFKPGPLSVLIAGTSFGLGILGAARSHSPTSALVWISISLGGLAAAAPVAWTVPSLIAPRESVGTLGGIVNFAGRSAQYQRPSSLVTSCPQPTPSRRHS